MAICPNSRDNWRFFKFSATNRAFSFKFGDPIREFSFKSVGQISRSLQVYIYVHSLPNVSMDFENRKIYPANINDDQGSMKREQK